MTGLPKHVAALFDFHVHSRHSPDGQGTVLDLARQAQRKGLQGFAVTDHNTFAARKELRGAAKETGLLVVPGMEITTTLGHCLALGIQKQVRDHQSLAETLEGIRDAGGVGVPSHPYRFFNGVGEGALKDVGRRLGVLEVYNARDGDNANNPRAEHYALHHRLGGTGGSDAHQIFEVGNGYTMFPEFPDGVDDVVSLVRRGQTWGAGTPTPRHRLFLQNFKNAALWIRRGFRPM